MNDGFGLSFNIIQQWIALGTPFNLLKIAPYFVPPQQKSEPKLIRSNQLFIREIS